MSVEQVDNCHLTVHWPRLCDTIRQFKSAQHSTYCWQMCTKLSRTTCLDIFIHTNCRNHRHYPD